MPNFGENGGLGGPREFIGKEMIMKLSIVQIGVAVATVALAYSTVTPAQTSEKKEAVTSPGHTADMPGREPHGPDHMKGKKKRAGKPVKSESAHTADMPGREPHPRDSAGASGPAVGSTGHTASMPGREPHSKEHEKK